MKLSNIFRKKERQVKVVNVGDVEDIIQKALNRCSFKTRAEVEFSNGQQIIKVKLYRVDGKGDSLDYY